jgi:hypothetical protein
VGGDGAAVLADPRQPIDVAAQIAGHSVRVADNEVAGPTPSPTRQAPVATGHHQIPRHTAKPIARADVASFPLDATTDP